MQESMKKAKAKLKQTWEENPLLVIGVGVAVVSALTKVAQVRTEARNSRAWQREVDRRILMKIK